MQRTARTTLGIAFVLSLVLHVTIVSLIHAPAQPQSDEPIPFNIETPRAVPTPRPTPTSTPAPTPRPTLHPNPPPRRSAPRPRRRNLHVTHQRARPQHAAPQVAASAAPVSRSGTVLGAPSGPAVGSDSTLGGAESPAQLPPSPQPTPAPTPTHPPACAQPNVPAATLEPVAPDTPALAAEAGISGNVTVLVSLDQNSRVVAARVIASASALLDEAAVRAARASRFRTEVRDCTSVAADYAFIVEFNAQ